MADSNITNYLGIGLASAIPASPNPPSGATEFYYETDTTTLKVWNGSAWVTAGGGGGSNSIVNTSGPPGIGRFPLSAMSWINQNGCSDVEITGGPIVVGLANFTGGGDNISILSAGSPGSAPWTITADLEALLWAENYITAGLVLYDSGSGKVLTFGLNGFASGTGGSPNAIRVVEWSGVTSYSGNPFQANSAGPAYRWLRIVNDGTNLTFYAGSNGVDWVELYQQTVTAFLPAITAFGVGGEYSFRGSASGEAGSAPPYARINIYSLKLDANTTGTDPDFLPPIDTGRPALSAFSWFNQGAATASDISGGPMVIRDTNDGTGGFHGLVKAAPTANFTLKARVGMQGVTDASNGPLFGLIAVSSSGAVVSFGLQSNDSSQTLDVNCSILRFSNATTYSAAAVKKLAAICNPIWLQLVYVYSTGTLTFSVSLDGYDWDEVGSETLSAFLSTFASVGFASFFGNTAASSSSSVRLYDWSGV
jgi:hypothetical protein